MVHLWKCEVLYQKLCQAAQEIKQKKITWPQYAQVEHDIVDGLAQTIRKEIAGANTSVESNKQYFDFAVVMKEKKAPLLSVEGLSC